MRSIPWNDDEERDEESLIVKNNAECKECGRQFKTCGDNEVFCTRCNALHEIRAEAMAEGPYEGADE